MHFWKHLGPPKFGMKMRLPTFFAKLLIGKNRPDTGRTVTPGSSRTFSQSLSRSVSMESPSNHISTAKRGSDQLLTPTKSKTGMPVTPRSAKRPSLGGADSSPGSPRGRTATHDSPRQICIRRVQAVVHVKEENDGQDSGGDEGSSDELMMRADVSSVSPAKRRRTGTHEHIAASV
ncbi:hypothetical protein B0H14DRAFT_3593705 [Mycena olivaceomarginata]|nr:hypothetical protein B0H14DRAFT_3593705 [Mycena olivaceomarginata]